MFRSRYKRKKKNLSSIKDKLQNAKIETDANLSKKESDYTSLVDQNNISKNEIMNLSTDVENFKKKMKN